MKLMLTMTAIVLCAKALTAQSLDDAAAQKAIQAGITKKYDGLLSTCAAHAGFGENVAANLAGGVQRNGGFSVIVSSNAGHVAFLAADAKRLYKSFGLADITDAMRLPMVFVSVYPLAPAYSQKTISVGSPIERVVLKSKDNPDAFAQPETFDSEPVQWKNLLGGSVEANSITATFPLEAIKKLPGDFDVVVVTAAGERRCKVGAKDRARIFP